MIAEYVIKVVNIAVIIRVAIRQELGYGICHQSYRQNNRCDRSDYRDNQSGQSERLFQTFGVGYYKACYRQSESRERNYYAENRNPAKTYSCNTCDEACDDKPVSF